MVHQGLLVWFGSDLKLGVAQRYMWSTWGHRHLFTSDSFCHGPNIHCYRRVFIVFFFLTRASPTCSCRDHRPCRSLHWRGLLTDDVAFRFRDFVAFVAPSSHLSSANPASFFSWNEAPQLSKGLLKDSERQAWEGQIEDCGEGQCVFVVQTVVFSVRWRGFKSVRKHLFLFACTCNQTLLVNIYCDF